jgi:cell division protease FtsH
MYKKLFIFLSLFQFSFFNKVDSSAYSFSRARIAENVGSIAIGTIVVAAIVNGPRLIADAIRDIRWEWEREARWKRQQIEAEERKKKLAAEDTTVVKKKLTLDDIVGHYDAKKKIKNIIKFIVDGKAYKDIGLENVYKGILLYGPPGTGKTLLARATAEELGSQFIQTNGNDYISSSSDDNVKSIKHLFNYAKKIATHGKPVIVFIDEFDAIAAGGNFWHSKSNDDLIKVLLTEMNGIEDNKNIIVMATTNYDPKYFNQALMRSGRFDIKIKVDLPNEEERIELIKIHSKKYKLGQDINKNTIKDLAKLSDGLVGADFELLFREAALESVNEGFEFIAKDVITKVLEYMTGQSKRTGAGDFSIFYPDEIKTRFSDVAGLEDAKEDLIEIIDFLKNPQKYSKVGAKIPKGVLFSGAPGNGKTLLARAVAGEAGVPFIYASASQFVQMYVGLGAARIRELFRQARRNAPCIIFIDELDAIGKRSSDNSGGSSEYNQTINQLLTEMDGFVQNETPVIVMGATNFTDAIDEALKRPGRFSRQIEVPSPNLNARLKILAVHARDKKLADDVDLKVIAKGTSGFSSAAIENLLNEAAILSVSRGKDKISMDEIEEAKDRIILGRRNADLVRKSNDLKKTAYHESGHAMMALLQKDYPYQFYKVTISSRGGTLGVSHSIPIDDQTGFSKNEMEALIRVSLAGRVAEQLMMNDINTGASSDFENATKIAQNMVTQYGMDEKMGVVVYSGSMPISSETQREIDMAVKNILDQCYKEVVAILTKNKDKLESLANALLEKETLDSEAVKKILKI